MVLHLFDENSNNTSPELYSTIINAELLIGLCQLRTSIIGKSFWLKYEERSGIYFEE